MNKRLMTTLVAVLAAFTLSVVTLAQNPTKKPGMGNQIDARSGAQTKSISVSQRGSGDQAVLAESIRHQLAMNPWYNVFDWLEAQVGPDGQVVLRGQVVRPVTQSDAVSAVKHVEGVTEVKNNIQVLPLSTFDDHIRFATYRAIYNFNSPLFRYSEGVVPPIHIIVDNGHVTLKGVVANRNDSQMAYLAASTVPGVFSVTNDLKVERAKG